LSRGKLKGEKMEIDKVTLSTTNYELQTERKQQPQGSYVTVPVGQTSPKKDEMKGLTIEREDVAADEIKREYNTKEERKKAEEKAKDDFLTYGTESGQKVATEKEAEKMAEKYVKNEQHKENVQGTRVFMDKEAYKTAEKERKTQRKELVKQYREQGLSRKEAKRKADSQLVENEYIKGRKTRKYVENNREIFYDQDGNFSSDKFKQKTVEFANLNSSEGEATNYHLSLKERRKAAEQEGVSTNVIKHMAKKSNLDYERDNTNLYKGLAIAGGTALGAGAGALGLFSSSAAAASASSAAAAAAAATEAGSAAEASSASSSSAAASAKTHGTAIGAATGLGIGLGLAALIKDKGNIEDKVYTPGKAPENPPKPDNQDQPTVPPAPDTTPNKPEEDCPTQVWQSEYCDHKIKKGEYWSNVIEGTMTVNGKKPAGNVLKALVHAEKIKHGITNFKLNTSPAVGQTMRLYTDFSDLLEDEAVMKKCPELKYLKDAEIQINCDGKIARGNTSGRPRVPYTHYNGNPVGTNEYKQDCHDSSPVRTN